MAKKLSRYEQNLQQILADRHAREKGIYVERPAQNAPDKKRRGTEDYFKAALGFALLAGGIWLYATVHKAFSTPAPASLTIAAQVPAQQSGAQPADDPSAMPTLPGSLPQEFSTIGTLAFLSEAAQICGLRNAAWGDAVDRDAATGAQAILNSMYPNGIPSGTQIDLDSYLAQSMKAGNGINIGECPAIKQSGLIETADKAAANAK